MRVGSDLQIQALNEQIADRDLSGKIAHERVRPHLKDGRAIYRDDFPNSLSKKGAVLALFFKKDDDYHLVFTVRKANLKEHSGQISFPGGRLEANESAMEAALRECREEIGIEVAQDKAVGPLSEIYISASDFEVVPFVSFLEDEPSFKMNDDEVAEIFYVPLRHLLDPINLKSEIRTIRDLQVDVPFYEWKSHKIWGATAAILAEILDLVKNNI